MFIYATKRGVNGFTFDPSIDEFCLTHTNIRCPQIGKTFSFNSLDLFQYPDAIRKYIYNTQEWNAYNPFTYTSRYVGSMVAGFTSDVIRGRHFFIPGDK
jgi:fructose-1,6-bisphosphatase I